MKTEIEIRAKLAELRNAVSKWADLYHTPGATETQKAVSKHYIERYNAQVDALKWVALGGETGQAPNILCTPLDYPEFGKVKK